MLFHIRQQQKWTIERSLPYLQDAVVEALKNQRLFKNLNSLKLVADKLKDKKISLYFL